MVYLDNLQVTHEHGPLLGACPPWRKDHYYPYGLGMAGISRKAMPSFVPDRYKANGEGGLVPIVSAYREYGNEEWADGSGLEMYETFYRSYNAQI